MARNAQNEVDSRVGPIWLTWLSNSCIQALHEEHPQELGGQREQLGSMTGGTTQATMAGLTDILTLHTL